MFAARGIPVVIGAEHHASLLGPLGASFLSLDIWVAEEDAEEAAALLRDLREPSANAVSGDSANGAVADAGDADGEHADAGESAAPEAEDASGDSVRMQIERRRRTGLALLLGCFITFGTAHMSTRAWLRGSDHRRRGGRGVAHPDPVEHPAPGRSRPPLVTRPRR